MHIRDESEMNQAMNRDVFRMAHICIHISDFWDGSYL